MTGKELLALFVPPGQNGNPLGLTDYEVVVWDPVNGFIAGAKIEVNHEKKQIIIEPEE